MPQIKKKHIFDLPIKINFDERILDTLVDKIHVITKDDDYLSNCVKQTKVKNYERRVNQMVYKLYDLTSKEIEVVENFNS